MKAKSVQQFEESLKERYGEQSPYWEIGYLYATIQRVVTLSSETTIDLLGLEEFVQGRG